MRERCRRKQCNRKVKARGLCYTHAKVSDKMFGNPHFAGNGTVKCYACGLPVVKHSIMEFCPFLDTTDMHTKS